MVFTTEGFLEVAIVKFEPTTTEIRLDALTDYISQLRAIEQPNKR